MDAAEWARRFTSTREALQTTEAREILSPVPAASPAVAAERPVIRCPRCRMVQYRTAMTRCRRCYLPLVVPVAAPPAPQPPARLNVAAGVKSWRNMRGLTQKQLAVASRLPRTYISRIENGRIIPGLLTLQRVAGAMRVTLPMLLVPLPNGNGGGGNGNGNIIGHNGNGATFRPGPPGNCRPARGILEADACLREILRYSGVLTALQRRQVLCRVRELVSPHLTMSH